MEESQKGIAFATAIQFCDDPLMQMAIFIAAGAIRAHSQAKLFDMLCNFGNEEIVRLRAIEGRN